MHDDFSALDFLFFGDFRSSSCPAASLMRKPRKRLMPIGRPGKSSRRLRAFLPFLAGKAPLSGEERGWPVPLSWPRQTISNDAFILDHSDGYAF